MRIVLFHCRRAFGYLPCPQFNLGESMLKHFALLAALFALSFCTFARAEEEEESVHVYRLLQPSVASIRNIEGSGTGVLLDNKGLIITNAHVLASPFPYTVEIEEAGSTHPVKFPHTHIIGFHPT